MAAVTTAKRQFATNTGVTQETHVLTQNVRQIAIQNYHATAVLSVAVSTGGTVAGALATATANAITSLGNDTFTVPPLTRVVVFKSPSAPKICGIAVISNTAATTYGVHGSDFLE